MIIWLDAHLSPTLAPWISLEFSISAIPVRDLGLRNSKDQEIFLAARQANATIMTKDADFVRLVEQSGIPPQVILLTCGNTSNEQLKQILERYLDRAMEWLQKGESIVEITGR
jgi:predicted nuclease of predicted toxin-antitoxin system